MNDIATDKRNHGFFIINNVVLDNYDLDPFSGWLYTWIVRRANRQTGVSFPSIQRLAKDAKMSKSSVKRSLKTLQSAGLISIVQRKDENENNLSNHYILHDVLEGGRFCENPGVGSVRTPNNTNIKQEGDEIKISSIEDEKEPSSDSPIEEPQTFKRGDTIYVDNEIPAVVIKKTPKRYKIQYIKGDGIGTMYCGLDRISARIDTPAFIDEHDIFEKPPEPKMKSTERFKGIEAAVSELFFAGNPTIFTGQICVRLYKEFEDADEQAIRDFAAWYRRDTADLQLKHPSRFVDDHFKNWNENYRNAQPKSRNYAAPQGLPGENDND